MGNTRDQVGKAGLFVAGGIFRTAFYVCVAVLIFWIGKSAYQFGYNVFNQQAVSPGAGQEVTRIMGILAGDEEQTGVTQDTAAAADTAAQTDTQTTDAGTDTADTQSADGTADTQAADGTAGEGESGQ